MKPSPSTILVIDDLPANLAILFDVLASAGFEVLVAESGEIALERMDILLPDLILLDLRLPGADGLDVLRALKSLPEHADIPVIILTAQHDTHDIVAGFAAGAIDYLRKPVEAEEVLVRVRTHLKIRKLQQQLTERNHALAREVRRRRAAERQLEHSLDIGVMVVTESGAVEFATRRAWDLLARFFPDSLHGPPPEVVHWICSGVSGDLSIKRPQGTLLLRIQSPRDKGESRLLRIEEHLNLLDPQPLEQLGLTPREAEVLFWMTQGKSSPEIALILHSAVNTIKKHAQNIFQKLGVDNRTAAAMRAMETLANESGIQPMSRR